MKSSISIFQEVLANIEKILIFARCLGTILIILASFDIFQIFSMILSIKSLG